MNPENVSPLNPGKHQRSKIGGGYSQRTRGIKNKADVLPFTFQSIGLQREPKADACFVFMAVLIVCCTFLSGCQVHSTSSDSTQPATGDDVQTETERGPVMVILQVTPARPQLSDELQLTLTIRSRSGTRIEKPPFVDAFEDFVVRDFHEPLPTVDGENNVLQQVYTLEPLRAGTLTVDPMTVRFHDTVRKADSDNDNAHVVTTEPLEIVVSTIVGDDVPTLTDLRPAANPVELPGEFSSTLLWVSLVVMTFAVGALWLWKRRRRQETQEPALSPGELARLELQRLIDRRLSETDVKEFYVELTAVVRRYIERTTGIRAPEQTTEEFLREIVTNDVFTSDEKLRLRSFLQSADLVKFAGLRPDAADVEAGILRAQEFINRRNNISTATSNETTATARAGFSTNTE